MVESASSFSTGSPGGQHWALFIVLFWVPSWHWVEFVKFCSVELHYYDQPLKTDESQMNSQEVAWFPMELDQTQSWCHPE